MMAVACMQSVQAIAANFPFTKYLPCVQNIFTFSTNRGHN
ncbi:hypothetical protein CLOSYM_02825 [[Clostridium] symbiosum ATCC 14940]|uniref:Uncharacterized protein n=1 Tax=[Clostridium] symbiosum ATCC 14940 TaxID=411472 RepID=A0ABC9TWG7_CLOSY|nr:hypothetical protein CLOSYM_02825 [[Clostridium] symbiosum ATCC 14940]